MDRNIKYSFHYVLPPWPLQDITLIYYISLRAKHLIRYWCKTWADWYYVNIIIIKEKHISASIVCMAVAVKRYWKTIWKDASYRRQKESSSQKVTTKRRVAKSNLHKESTNYIYLLSFTQISKAFYVDQTRVSHCHSSPSPPNTSIM